MSVRAILAGALGLPATASDDQLARTMADRMAPEPSRLSLTETIDAMATALGQARPLQDTPGDRFHQLAELRARAEGVSLAEAYRRQSESTPELWTDVRNAAPRGY